MGVLRTIVASKKQELAELRRAKFPAPPGLPPPLFADADEGSGDLRLICEIKLKSPSAGPLSRALSVSERARAYEEGGAWMVSVLCDSPFFDGSYEHLKRAREGCSLPLLCKEFVLDECQLDAAASYGASAVLLIVRCLEQDQLMRLVEGAQQRGLTPLVEVFTEVEAQRALDAGARFVGVNSRDLDTLEMDSERAARIVDQLPDGVFRAQLSGTKSSEAVAEVARSKADAALIGEVLMRQDHPTELLRTFAAAARRS